MAPKRSRGSSSGGTGSGDSSNDKKSDNKGKNIPTPTIATNPTPAPMSVNSLPVVLSKGKKQRKMTSGRRRDHSVENTSAKLPLPMRRGGMAAVAEVIGMAEPVIAEDEEEYKLTDTYQYGSPPEVPLSLIDSVAPPIPNMPPPLSEDELMPNMTVVRTLLPTQEHQPAKKDRSRRRKSNPNSARIMEQPPVNENKLDQHLDSDDLIEAAAANGELSSSKSHAPPIEIPTSQAVDSTSELEPVAPPAPLEDDISPDDKEELPPPIPLYEPEDVFEEANIVSPHIPSNDDEYPPPPPPAYMEESESDSQSDSELAPPEEPSTSVPTSIPTRTLLASFYPVESNDEATDEDPSGGYTDILPPSMTPVPRAQYTRSPKSSSMHDNDIKTTTSSPSVTDTIGKRKHKGKKDGHISDSEDIDLGPAVPVPPPMLSTIPDNPSREIEYRMQKLDNDIFRTLKFYFHSSADISSDQGEGSYIRGKMTNTDDDGMLPMHHLMSVPHVEIWMVEKTLQVNPTGLRAKDKLGRTALHHLCTARHYSSELTPPLPHFDSADGVLPSTSLEIVSQLNGSKYSFAAVPLPGYSLELFQFLIRQHPRAMRIRDSSGHLPVHYLARHCSDPAILGFVEQSYPGIFTRKDKDGWLPIHHAAKYNQKVEVLEFLLDIYPKGLREATSHGSLPIHCAAYENTSLSVIRLLMTRFPASLRTRGHNGMLPLHCALRNNASLGLVELILGRYPQALYALDQFHRLPLHHAFRNQQLAKDKGVFGQKAVKMGITNTTMCELGVRLLLQLDEKMLNMKDTNQCTPLHHAARHSASVPLLQLIINAYPDALSAVDIKGMLPLHHVVINRRSTVEMISCLLEPYPEAVTVRELEGGRFPHEIAAPQSAKHQFLYMYHLSMVPANDAAILSGISPYEITSSSARMLDVVRIHVCGDSRSGKTVVSKWLGETLAESWSSLTPDETFDTSKIRQKNAISDNDGAFLPTSGTFSMQSITHDARADRRVHYLVLDHTCAVRVARENTGEDKVITKGRKLIRNLVTGVDHQLSRMSSEDSVYVVVLPFWDFRAGRKTGLEELSAMLLSWLGRLYAVAPRKRRSGTSKYIPVLIVVNSFNDMYQPSTEEMTMVRHYLLNEIQQIYRCRVADDIVSLAKQHASGDDNSAGNSDSNLLWSSTGITNDAWKERLRDVACDFLLVAHQGIAMGNLSSRLAVCNYIVDPIREITPLLSSTSVREPAILRFCLEVVASLGLPFVMRDEEFSLLLRSAVRAFFSRHLAVSASIRRGNYRPDTEVVDSIEQSLYSFALDFLRRLGRIDLLLDDAEPNIDRRLVLTTRHHTLYRQITQLINDYFQHNSSSHDGHLSPYTRLHPIVTLHQMNNWIKEENNAGVDLATLLCVSRLLLPVTEDPLTGHLIHSPLPTVPLDESWDEDSQAVRLSSLPTLYLILPLYNRCIDVETSTRLRSKLFQSPISDESLDVTFAYARGFRIVAPVKLTWLHTQIMSVFYTISRRVTSAVTMELHGDALFLGCSTQGDTFYNILLVPLSIDDEDCGIQLQVISNEQPVVDGSEPPILNNVAWHVFSDIRKYLLETLCAKTMMMMEEVCFLPWTTPSSSPNYRSEDVVTLINLETQWYAPGFVADINVQNLLFGVSISPTHPDEIQSYQQLTMQTADLPLVVSRKYQQEAKFRRLTPHSVARALLSSRTSSDLPNLLQQLLLDSFRVRHPVIQRITDNPLINDGTLSRTQLASLISEIHTIQQDIISSSVVPLFARGLQDFPLLPVLRQDPASTMSTLSGYRLCFACPVCGTLSSAGPDGKGYVVQSFGKRLAPEILSALSITIAVAENVMEIARSDHPKLAQLGWQLQDSMSILLEEFDNLADSLNQAESNESTNDSEWTSLISTSRIFRLQTLVYQRMKVDVQRFHRNRATNQDAVSMAILGENSSENASVSINTATSRADTVIQHENLQTVNRKVFMPVITDNISSRVTTDLRRLSDTFVSILRRLFTILDDEHVLHSGLDRVIRSEDRSVTWTCRPSPADIDYYYQRQQGEAVVGNDGKANRVVYSKPLSRCALLFRKKGSRALMFRPVPPVAKRQ